MQLELSLNGQTVSVDVDPMMPLLWVVRDVLKLKGTKYSCGRALCGACTLHIDGKAVRSCSYPVNNAVGKQITTLEGLSKGPENLHPIQQAWMEENVPQCGYCQPGFMMAAAGLLNENPNPSEEEIKEKVTNICRCGTHPRILKAIKRAVDINAETSNAEKNKAENIELELDQTEQ